MIFTFKNVTLYKNILCSLYDFYKIIFRICRALDIILIIKKKNMSIRLNAELKESSNFGLVKSVQ